MAIPKDQSVEIQPEAVPMVGSHPNVCTHHIVQYPCVNSSNKQSYQG